MHTMPPRSLFGIVDANETLCLSSRRFHVTQDYLKQNKRKMVDHHNFYYI